MTNYKIPEENIERLETKIADLNKRADRFGLQHMILIKGEAEYVESKTDSGEKIIRKYFPVTIEGPEVQIEGWQLIAALDHSGNGNGNIVRVSPCWDRIIPEHYRTASSENCDHCHTRRSDRIKTYILFKDGEYKQVGSTCLRDFMGHGSPESIAKTAEYLWSFDAAEFEFLNDGDRNYSEYRLLEEVLAHAFIFIRTEGYVSVRKAEEKFITPTKARVLSNLVSKDDDKLIPQSRDYEKAKEAIAWARAIEDKTDDYSWNLHILAEGEYIHRRSTGFACALAYSYTRATEVKVEKKNEHFGTVGKRAEYDLTVTHMKVGEGSNGYWTLIGFIDPENRCAVWFASGVKEDEFEVGKTYHIKATVKNHGEYNGLAQTQLTRCAVV